MKKIIDKKSMRLKRAKKTRCHIKKMGIEKEVNRLIVHRSGKHIYGQVLAPVGGTVLAQASSLELRGGDKLAKTETSKQVGKILAERIKTANVDKLACDRSGFKYHGRVAAVVDTLREHGINI